MQLYYSILKGLTTDNGGTAVECQVPSAPHHHPENFCPNCQLIEIQVAQRCQNDCTLILRHAYYNCRNNKISYMSVVHMPRLHAALIVWSSTLLKSAL